MRLKPAGIVLIILLLILCPLGAAASYVALTGVAVGPLNARATATATTTRGSIPAAPPLAPTPVAANPTTTANMTPTTIRSNSPAPSTSGSTPATIAVARPSTAPSVSVAPNAAGPTPTVARAGATPSASGAATLGQNVFALRDNTTIGNRLNEIDTIWKAGGKSVAMIAPADLIDGSLIQKANAQSGLGSTNPPLNASFTLTQQITVPALGGGQTQAVAELPLKQIEFQPDSAILTDAGRTALLQQVVPVLKQTPGLYLRVEGSAYQPTGDTLQANEAFARSRAQAVIYFLITQGIDANRFIEGYLKPQFPGSQNPAEQQQDRRVVFTLVQQGGR